MGKRERGHAETRREKGRGNGGTRRRGDAEMGERERGHAETRRARRWGERERGHAEARRRGDAEMGERERGHAETRRRGDGGEGTGARGDAEARRWGERERGHAEARRRGDGGRGNGGTRRRGGAQMGGRGNGGTRRRGDAEWGRQLRLDVYRHSQAPCLIHLYHATDWLRRCGRARSGRGARRVRSPQSTSAIRRPPSIRGAPERDRQPT